MSGSSRLQAEIPEAFAALFEPKRYKVYHGGRGGAKSWNFGRTLLITGCQRPLRTLCAREFQNSISDSVHRLLSDQIAALNIGYHYQVQSNAIIGPGGTEFAFIGLRYNIGNMKSYEGFDRCWVEEAKDVSKRSWETLIPTIRKDDSEIWASFNPELETDETYQRFVTRPPTNALVKRVTWRDNPWFPEVLRREMDDLKERDYDAYLNVWEGHCRLALEGAVFAREIRLATAQDRITSVPWEAGSPVHTVWDLGHADQTAIWFVQMVGFEYRVIDFYQSHGEKLTHYAKVLQAKPYAYGDAWLPHDANHQLLGAPLTIVQQLRAHQFRTRLVPDISVAQGIEAARTIFSKCWFDAAKCADGLQSLRHYRYEQKMDGVSYAKQPLHDWSSDAADAFRYLAVAMRADLKTPSPPSAYGDYDPLAGVPHGGMYGRTHEQTDYDPLR
ncbi:MAG: PBSX family phage terminase large subunit [Candidatus Binataceae bacterium]